MSSERGPPPRAVPKDLAVLASAASAKAAKAVIFMMPRIIACVSIEKVDARARSRVRRSRVCGSTDEKEQVLTDGV